MKGKLTDDISVKQCEVPGCTRRMVSTNKENWYCGPECRNCCLSTEVIARVPHIMRQPERRIAVSAA